MTPPAAGTGRRDDPGCPGRSSTPSAPPPTRCPARSRRDARQISITASATPAAARSKFGFTACARSTNNSTAAEPPAVQRRDRPQLLGRPATLPRRRQHRHRVRPGKDRLDQIRRRVEHVLTVVEHDQQPPARQRPGDAVGHRQPGLGGDAQLGGHRVGHRRRVTDRGQLDQPHPVRRTRRSPRRRPRSPDGSCRPHPPRSTSPTGGLPPVRRARPPRRRGPRTIVGGTGRFPGTDVAARESRELPHQIRCGELEHRLGPRQALEGVLAETLQPDPFGQVVTDQLPRPPSETSTWPPWASPISRAARFTAEPK